MAQYFYRAVNGNGAICTGIREAASATHLGSQLKHAGLELIRAREARERLHPPIRKTSRAQLIAFFFNLEQFARSGVPLLDGLADLRDSADDRRFRDVSAALMTAIENGSRLSQAMAQHPASFDEILVGLTRAGEESGNLADVFGRITEMLKWQDELAAQTRSMMLYPAFTGVTVLAVTLFLLLRLVPQLAGFIRQSGQELPLHTRFLLAVSDWLVHDWHILLAAPMLLYGAFALALGSSQALRYRLDRMKLSIRPGGPILHKIMLARFAHTFAMMYGSGIGILDCLASTRKLSRNTALIAGLDAAAHSVESGNSLAQSLRDSGLFPPSAIRMIGVGETTGRLEAALSAIGYFYDRDAKEAVKKLQALAEPTTTVLLGALLGWVMLSVLAPIYSLVGRMGM